jgi:hypothetical protein
VGSTQMTRLRRVTRAMWMYGSSART